VGYQSVFWEPYWVFLAYHILSYCTCEYGWSMADVISLLWPSAECL